MSDDIQQAGVVPVEPTSPAVEDEVNSPSPAVEDVIPAPEAAPVVEPEPKLSRRKEKQQEREEGNAVTEERLSQIEADLAFSRGQRLVSEKEEAIKNHGILPEDFDQVAFDAEIESLAKDGILDSRAVDIAVRMQIGTKAQEVVRENGRLDAAIPPATMTSPDAISNDKYPQLSKDAYMALMPAKVKELGEAEGIKYVKAYSAWQTAQGRTLYKG